MYVRAVPLVYLVAESSVDLQGDIEIFVPETDVCTEKHLRHSLSGDVPVASVLDIHTAVIVEVGNGIAVCAVGILRQSGAVGQVENAKGLSYNLVDDVVVTAVESCAV